MSKTFATLSTSFTVGFVCCVVSFGQSPGSSPASGVLSTASGGSTNQRVALTVNFPRAAEQSAPLANKAEDSAASAGTQTKENSAGNNIIAGALMLCGGGPLPDQLFNTFFELGQSNKGSLVIIPSASGRADAGDFSGPLSEWKSFPWSRVEVLHARDRKHAETSESLVEPLKRATAVWISGGDQRRLAERYLGTPVEKEIQRVVSRGGIVGGTSAGSAIASRVMISGGKQKPVIASGLDLLPGSIIDMHFSQRKRYDRLASAVEQHPDRVGIGIDECTGLVISSDEARVVGNGSVYVYSKQKPDQPKPESVKFDAGSAFRLTSLPAAR